MSAPAAEFFREYANHRAREGRAIRGGELRSLPYLRVGPLAKQWAVRARSFDAFRHRVLEPIAKNCHFDVLDLGAGNGWLSWQLARHGHRCVALDIRGDEVDGLGAARELLDATGLFQCVTASFESLPFVDRLFDLAVFNASLHYATDLHRVLSEAIRVVRRGGTIVVLDSPFYSSDDDGRNMIAEKQQRGASEFGQSAEVLLSPNFIEYLTRDRLKAAMSCLSWTRHRVRYPLWYELRPLVARVRGLRRPSRFDVWSARVP